MRSIGLLLLALLPVCAGAPVQVRQVEPSALKSGRSFRSYPARFISCHDGDTCDFAIHLGLSVSVYQTTRLFGIDTPELRGDSYERAVEVRDFVIRTLQQAQAIELFVPQRRKCRWDDGGCDERGKYGRLLVEIDADGQSVNGLLLRTGRADVY